MTREDDEYERAVREHERATLRVELIRRQFRQRGLVYLALLGGLIVLELIAAWVDIQHGASVVAGLLLFAAVFGLFVAVSIYRMRRGL